MPTHLFALQQLLMPTDGFNGFQGRRPVELIPEQLYAEIGTYSFGRGIFHKTPWTGAEVGDKKLFVIKEGDFILQITFAWEGAVALASKSEDGMYGSVRFLTFRVDESRCFPPYLVYYFRTRVGLDQLGKISPGSAGRNRVLSVKRIPEVLLLLPPLLEQRRIVAQIEELSAKIEEARSLRQNAIQEAEALIDSSLAARVRALIRQHGTRRLEELILDAGYGTSTKCHYNRSESSVPVLRIPNVASERVNFEDLKYGVLNTAELQRVLVEPGDILVVRTNGSADLVGRCAVVPKLLETTAFASYMIRIHSDSSAISPAYLQLMLKHLRTNAELIDFARTTAGQYNISLGRLRAAELPVPSLDIQRELVEEMDDLQAKVHSVKKLQEETEEELNALMPSILSCAFSDEP